MTTEGDVEYCEWVTRSEGYGPTAINPPETCENIIETPGEVYCPQHLQIEQDIVKYYQEMDDFYQAMEGP